MPIKVYNVFVKRMEEKLRFIIQRTKNANVKVNQEVVGKIDKGFTVLIGISEQDDEKIADKMTDKMLKLRIFEDENGKTNLSLKDVEGELLMISQFTLYANCKRGNRPSFIEAGSPDKANNLYEYIMKRCEDAGYHVERGVFGEDMKVELINDGPFTIILDSENI